MHIYVPQVVPRRGHTLRVGSDKREISLGLGGRDDIVMDDWMQLLERSPIRIVRVVASVDYHCSSTVTTTGEFAYGLGFVDVDAIAATVYPDPDGNDESGWIIKEPMHAATQIGALGPVLSIRHTIDGSWPYRGQQRRLVQSIMNTQAVGGSVRFRTYVRCTVEY